MKSLFIILFCFIFFSSFSQVEKNFDVISVGINASAINLEKKIEDFINADSTIKNIKTLEISGNFIKIPNCVYKFYWIEELLINSTKPIVINTSINKFVNLEHLKVFSEITYISNKIILKKLKRIDFDFYNSCVFPSFIILQKNLEYLKIGTSRIKKIPRKISNCKKLKFFLLYTSKIKRLPKTFYNLNNIEVLALCSSPIKINFSRLSEMKKLKEVILNKDHKYVKDANIEFIFCE